MAVPKSKEARLFYRCALQRFEEAQILLKATKTTGAVYMAGYGVECILKALILSMVKPSDASDVLRSFRGPHGHDYDWLRSQYLLKGGARFPPDVNQSFTLVNDWSSELRYTPRTINPDEADEFMAAAEAIIRWADGRL